MVNTKKQIGVIALIVILGLSIFISTGIINPNRGSTVLGIAYLDGPLVGATITAYDSGNNVIAAFPEVTLDSGVFMLSLPWGLFQWSPPTEVTLKASGGSIFGEPFNGTIVRNIDGFDENQVYSLNAITTIVAAYKSAHEQASLSDSQEAVFSFLDIKSGSGIESVEDNTDSVRLDFDHFIFMSEAELNGGFDSFVAHLIVEMDGGNAVYSFKSSGMVSGVMGDLFSWAGSSIASGAMSYVGGQAMGWVMNLLGYESAEDKIINMLEEVSQKLDQVDRKLDSISHDLVLLSNQISELKKALSATETNLDKRISEIASYDPVSRIQSSYSQLDIYSKCKPGEVSLNSINGWASSVLDPNTGAYYALTSLDNFIMGHVLGSESGLLEVLCDSSVNSLAESPGDHFGRSYRTKVYNVAQGMISYFEKLLFVELKGLTVIAEAHHARNETVPVVQYLEQYWLPRLERQVELFVVQMEKFVTLSEAKYFLEFPNMGSIPVDKQTFLQNRWQQVYHMNVPNVAEILPQVDRFADQVLNGSGNFVVRVLYVQTSTHDLTPTDVMPVFENLQTGQTYSAVGSLKKFADNQGTGSYYLYRYTLNATAGSYKLVSPTSTFSGPTAPGWKTNLDVSLEGWSLQDALTMSQGSYLGQQGFVQVTNDANGHPYGYWGGQWLDLGIA
jgi:flagellin-like hook-associated protein FlgL